MAYVTRFAPSPTGPLHLGHAYSALTAWRRAREAGGLFLLRIEDIDTARCRPDWEQAIIDDLHWLGLRWPEPVMRQSTRLPAYRAALGRLADLGVIYPCRCTRGDIRAALSAPQEGAAPSGPDGPVYPGTCRARPMALAGPLDALRLDIRRALTLTGPLSWQENGPLFRGTHVIDPETAAATIGDVILARRDIATSYHLSVVVDDGAQGVSEVVRGADLLGVTPIHTILHEMLEHSQPSYWHHELIRDSEGRRLAKRDDARALSLYREEGTSPDAIRRMIGL